ncbi:MAG: tetratricopeptide repeat protein [Bacteroidetes bacterium]|nr:tetratricopeptide repeat protein [Bacteroidota bacterium]
MLKNYLSAVFLVVFALQSAGQQTLSFIEKEAAYKKGMELFDEKNFLAAREKFEEIYKQKQEAINHRSDILIQNLEYYVAVCATEANDKDAEKLLLDYREKYHENDKRRLINFYLGKYYYSNRNYNEAVEYFTQVKTKDLDNNQLYEYRFQLGYCYFVKKKFTEAKPLFASIKEIKEKYYYPATYYYGFICFYNKDYDEALSSFSAIEDSKMYSQVIPYYIAQIYFLKKDYDKLIPYLNKNIERSDVMYREEMKYLLGKTYFQKGDYKQALPLLNAYLSKQSKMGKEDIYELGYALYQNKEYAKAIENFKQIYSLEEKLGQNAAYAMADCYLNLEKKTEARAAFQNAANKDSDESIQENAMYNYGKLSFELGFSSEAIQSFQSYLDKYPVGVNRDGVNELLAAVLVQTKNYDKAYRIMENMKLNSVLIKEAYQKVTYFRAIELFNDNKTEEALALCNKSLQLAINVDLQALATYLKAEIQFRNENYDEAISNYLLFAQLATPSLEQKGEASKFRAYYNIGYCYFKKKSYSNAAVYFSQAISEADHTPDKKAKTALVPDLYQRYGDCSFATKNYSKAIEAYSKVVENQWSAADYAQYRKGVILGLTNRSNDKIEAMNSLIRKYPSSNYADEAYFEIGETYLEQGSKAQARSAYQNVIANYPNSNLLPKCYLKMAVIDYSTGKKEQALEDYKTVVKKFPSSKESRESLDALKDLYVELGRADEYFDFVKNNSSVTISSSEQDSLTFQSAENAYNANDCARAISLYANYIGKFPQGFFTNEARWKKADCHLKAKEFSVALIELEDIIQNRYSKYFEKALLKASGIAFYELKDYNKANTFYKQLYISSTSEQNTYTAMIGLFRTAVKLDNTTETIEYADQLLNSGMAKDADIQEAYFEKAKASYSRGDKEYAAGAFNRVTEFPVSEKAVEAKYMAAKILFEQKEYKRSLDTCFRLKNKYSSYEYWVAKTFILIADNYIALGNQFQAKATLQSIVENYEGDKTVLEEAKTKLEAIRTDELGKSKILLPDSSDHIIMEPDSLINR